MKQRPVSCCLLSVCALLLVASAAAQTLPQDVAKFVETPAVPGYEQALAAEIRTRVPPSLGRPQTDNLGNLYITLGSGSPHRLIVAPMDEPGYVVSGITADGYLRVQRLPQQSPHPLFDLLHTAQPVVVHTRRGKWVPGVFAGLSTHLQPNRQNAPRGAHPDEIYVDIGASSAAEVAEAGVALLDPVALDRKLYPMGFDKLTGPSVGDRFGCAALVELLRRIEPAKLRGTLTVAFVAQQWASSRGLDRLTQHIKADETLYVGRMLARRTGPGGRAEAQAEPRVPAVPPGRGVLIGAADREAAPAGLEQEIKRLAEENKIPVTVDYSAPLPRVSYTQGPVLPQRFVHLGIATAWPLTPAELVDANDLQNLVNLLEVYAQRSSRGRAAWPASTLSPALPERPQTAPAPAEILKILVETYGASGHEEAVRKAITALLPPWARTETDAAGNLILHLGATRMDARKGPQGLRIAFVAHMDEIGYRVRSITEDGPSGCADAGRQHP